jgi:hypothetical protein
MVAKAPKESDISFILRAFVICIIGVIFFCLFAVYEGVQLLFFSNLASGTVGFAIGALLITNRSKS